MDKPLPYTNTGLAVALQTCKTYVIVLSNGSEEEEEVVTEVDWVKAHWVNRLTTELM